LMNSRSTKKKSTNTKTYGSTSSRPTTLQLSRDKLILHHVQRTDTFQGLALKYGVSIEQIKRVNKLWSSDNLTLRSRSTLYIPIPLPQSQDELLLTNGHYNASDDERGFQIKDDESVADFLIRIDSKIALTKDKVKNMRTSQELDEDDFSMDISETDSENGLFRLSTLRKKYDNHIDVTSC